MKNILSKYFKGLNITIYDPLGSGGLSTGSKIYVHKNKRAIAEVLKSMDGTIIIKLNEPWIIEILELFGVERIGSDFGNMSNFKYVGNKIVDIVLDTVNTKYILKHGWTDPLIKDECYITTGFIWVVGLDITE